MQLFVIYSSEEHESRHEMNELMKFFNLLRIGYKQATIKA